MKIWHMNQSLGWGGPHKWEVMIPLQQGMGGGWLTGSVFSPNTTVTASKSSQKTPELVAAFQRTSGSLGTRLGTGGPLLLRVFSQTLSCWAFPKQISLRPTQAPSVFHFEQVLHQFVKNFTERKKRNSLLKTPSESCPCLLSDDRAWQQRAGGLLLQDGRLSLWPPITAPSQSLHGAMPDAGCLWLGPLAVASS